MTEPTFPITVHLTEAQMNNVEQHWSLSGTSKVFIDAIKAQRPRPIQVGDQVKWNGWNNVTSAEVRAVHNGKGWLWQGDTCFGTYSLSDLTRIDDEAAT